MKIAAWIKWTLMAVVFLPAGAHSGDASVYQYRDGRVHYQAPAGTARWHIPEQQLPSLDVAVAGASVRDFGAVADGETDATDAFQEAMLFMYRNGGGAVWVPAGHYAIRGNLVVPQNVTLRGEWAPPDGELRGSVLLAYAGRGDAEAEPFLTIYPNGGVRGLAIWYPEQVADNPVPYPWTIVRPDTLVFKPSFTVEEVTIVNAWRGIRIGLPVTGNGNWLLRRIYMTALESGIETDMTNDIGRLYAVFLSPRFWQNSGLPGAPADRNSAALAHMRERGVGMTVRRHDFTHHGPFSIEGYAVGFRGAASKSQEHEGHFGAEGANHFQGHFYGINIRDCVVALELSGVHAASVTITDSLIAGEKVGLRISDTPAATVQLNNCDLSAPVAIENKGLWALNLFDSRVRGMIDQHTGALSFTGGSIQAPGPIAVRLADSTTAALFKGVSGLNRRNIKGLRETDAFIFDGQSIPRTNRDHPGLNLSPAHPLQPSARELLVIDDLDNEGAEDVSAALQAGMDKIAADGGGIVFLPAGFYRLDHPVRVPSGVELRGANDSPHHLGRSATVFRVYWGKGKPDGEAAISLSPQSGIRGVGFVYPQMDYREPPEFAWTLRSLGADVYIVNISAGGVDRLIDLATFRSDRHHVNQVMANPIRVGVAAGSGSTDGQVLDCQFITHAWALLPVVASEETLLRFYTDSLAAMPTSVWSDEASGKRHNQLLQDNLRAFVLDDTVRQTLFFNFIYACFSGLDIGFNGRAGGAIFHHGADVSTHGVRIRNISREGISLINYMVYGRGWEDTVAVEIQSPSGQRAVFRSLQVVGPLTHAIKQVSGDTVFEQPLFAVPGRQGLVFEAGDFTMLAPSFFYYDNAPRMSVQRQVRGELISALTAGPFRPALGQREVTHERFSIDGSIVAPSLLTPNR